MGITKDLAHYIAKAKFEDLPPNVVRIAKQLVLNDIGCAFGGLLTDEAKIFINFAKDIGGKPEVTIIGDGSKVPVIIGAGVNAFLANALDFDTVDRNRYSTSSMPVRSAIAMAEREGASGKDLILSIVTAHDVFNRIRDATEPSPELQKRYLNSSHATFGTMIAAAKILRLDEDSISSAIGIAGHTAPLVNINLWFKALPCSPIKHAGFWQCQSGIEAALLAQRGFLGPPDILDEKEWGYWAGVSDKVDWSLFTRKLGEEYYLEKYLTFKPWSCITHNHPGIEMLLEFLEREKIDPMDIDEIVYKKHAHMVSRPMSHVVMPREPFEAMYSVAWALATMALGYQPGPGWFSEERRNDPRVRELVKRIKLEEDPEVTRVYNEEPGKSLSKMTVKAKGKFYHMRMEYVKGSPQKPMTQEELERKFSSMAKLIVSDKQAERIINIVNHLEEVDNVRELTQWFKPV